MAFNGNISRTEITDLDFDCPGNVRIGANAINAILTNFLSSRRGSVPLNRDYGISLNRNLFSVYTDPTDLELFIRNDLDADLRDYFGSSSISGVTVKSNNDNTISVSMQLSIEGESFTFEENIQI